MPPTKRQIPIKYSIFSEFSHLQLRYFLRHQRSLLRGSTLIFPASSGPVQIPATHHSKTEWDAAQRELLPGELEPRIRAEYLFLPSAVPHSSGSKLDPNSCAGTDHQPSDQF